MLNADALSQLGALRQNLRTQQPRIEGVVLPTRQRTGFVLGDDGQRYLLNADDMQQLLPGDRIECVISADAEPPEAQLERIVHADIQSCVGCLLAHKGKRWLQLDHAQTQRRLPVSAEGLSQVELGSWVHCSIARQPGGSPQARIDALIAEPDTPFWMHHVALAKMGRTPCFSPQVEAEVAALSTIAEPEDYGDLTTLSWVTIDQSSTEDMDDAIHVETMTQGWQVSVAIADASHWVQPGSELDVEARHRYASQYMPGWVLPMLPVDVGVHQCALVPDQVRLALVLQAQISAEGRVQNYTFQFARIQSQAKLSYEQVNLALCSEPEAVPMALLPMLQAAQAVTSLLREQRACLDTPDRPEYQLEVDEMGLMTGVECLTRGPAQLLVEELMLLMNHLAAEHLAAHQVGLFLSHNGFKSERWPELQQLLAPFFDAPLAAPPSYEEFQALLPKIVATDARLPMLLSRHYCRSQLVAEAKPHWGLGLSSYTTVTSPIRRYLDLALHRQLKAIWRGEPVTAVSSVAELAAGHLEQRELERLVTRWLYAQWMAPRVGETFTAEVQHMMPAGCLVHLLGIGCTGFMPLRAWQDSQAKFDSVLMQHHLSFGVLTLGDTVTVKLQRVDTDQRQMAFELQC